MTTARALIVGFIPLVDAASLIVAADKGFAAAEGLDLQLAREVSWSNIRDRLAIGHYDAAHLLTPMAIASALGLRHVKAPIVAAMTLAMNGNAVVVSPALLAALNRVAEGELTDPGVSARALARIADERAAKGDEALTFGMTFPFSMHSYQLRYWMADGGLDPDKDVRLVVVPPPYMVESLAKGQVDGFCVGAPWSSVAVDAGVGAILHLGCEIFDPAPEKTLALRQDLAKQEPETVEALVRACVKAADFIKTPANREEVVAILARPDRVGVEAAAIRRSLEGAPDARRQSQARDDYLILGDRMCGRPDPRQAAWLYAQMLRWRQTQFSQDELRAAERVFSPKIFEAVHATNTESMIAAYRGETFDPNDIRGYLANFKIGAKL